MERNNHKQEDSFNSRTVFTAVVGLGILSAFIYWINFEIGDFIPVFAKLTDIHLYVILFLSLSAIYFIAVFLVVKLIPAKKKYRGLTGVIIFLAIFFRLVLIAEEPEVLSGDMYRYIWDGRLQFEKINPYLYPPEADELKDMRDDQIFPNINRKNYRTLYPAGAQFFFRIFYILVGNSVIGYKGIMVFFDIMTLLVLAALLQNRGLNLSRIIVYAWNPLVIFEIAYSGHLEGLTVFLVVAALYLYAIQKDLPATIMLALSAAVKLYPALLLAAFLNRGNRIKGIITFTATLILLYLPFVGAGRKIFGFLPVYLNNPYESFNLGLKYFMMRLIPGLNYYLLSLLFIFVLVMGGVIVFLKEKKDIEKIWYAYFLAGLLLILMPASLHPWYAILIIPFQAIYPGSAWLLFACTVTLSYLKYTAPRGIMPTWVLLAEYLPLFALLTVGYILRKDIGGGKITGLVSNRKNEKMADVHS